MYSPKCSLYLLSFALLVVASVDTVDCGFLPGVFGSGKQTSLKLHQVEEGIDESSRAPPRLNEVCDYDASKVVDGMLDNMRNELVGERMNIKNGLGKDSMGSGTFSISNARIVNFEDLLRTQNSCVYRADKFGYRVAIPFSAELRNVDVAADLLYEVYFAGTRGKYTGTFSYIAMNGTIEAWPFENKMALREFSITGSQVSTDDIQMDIVPSWMMNWVGGYFAQDNTHLYERLARAVVEREVANFKDFGHLRDIVRPSHAMRKVSFGFINKMA